MLCFLQYRLSPYRRMASPAKERAEEQEETDYDPGTSGSEAGTPKKGPKKKETPDPGLTLGTDIKDHLKPDGRQVEVELDNVIIDQEKTKGQIRRKDTKLMQKHIESLEAAPPTGPLHVVLWEDNSMLPTDCSLFLLREPSRIDVFHFADGNYWCVSGQHSVEAIARIREKRRTACLDQQQWHTTCIADILKPTTPWAFRAKLAGQAQGSAQDIEPIPLYEAADNLIRCVRIRLAMNAHLPVVRPLLCYPRWGATPMHQKKNSFDVLKISGGEAWLTRTAISRSPLWMLCR